jgi:hypothetical protein
LEFVPWWAHFSPDGRRAVLAVRRPDGVQGYVIDLENAHARAVTPPLRDWGPTSPDWRLLAVVPVEGKPTAYPLDQGISKELPGIQDNEHLVAWTRSGLLVTPDVRPGKPGSPPARIFRVDPASGARQVFTTLGPAEAPGADRIRSVFVTADERIVAYSYLRATSQLFLFDFERNRRAELAPQ